MTLTTDITAIDQTIQQLEREAAQAQTSSSVSGSEAAIAQKAIRELTTTKAEILAKERLWDRDAQLQRALAERNAVADRARQALGAGGSLAAQRKTDLEAALKAKAGIDPSGNLNAVFNAVKGVDDTRQTDDNTARNKWQSAATALANAKRVYDSKAEAAEEAWAAIQNSPRSLDEQLGKAQQRLAEAAGLTAAAALPSPAPPTQGLTQKSCLKRTQQRCSTIRSE